MSQVKIQGNASGTGIFTIASPNSNSNRTLDLPDNSGTVMTSASAVARNQMFAGAVLQVVSTTKTDFFTTTSSSFTDVTGLSVSITPTSASSKILVLANVSYGSSADDVLIRLVRDSTHIGTGTGGSANNGFNQTNGNAPVRYAMQTGSVCYLDSPATTSATTYKIQIVAQGGTSTACVNRRGENTTYGGSSMITVLEVAA